MSSDIDRLQGAWNIITSEVEGQKFPAMGAQIVVTGTRFVSLNMGAEYGGSLSVNETCTPRTFDLLYETGPHAGKKSLGIYELSGTEWKMCLGLAGVARPAGFMSGKGTGHALQTLRRGTKPAPRAEEAGDTEPTELEGEWTMKSCIQDGQPLQKSYAEKMRRVFAGGRTTLYFGTQISGQSRFSLKAGGHIDYIDLEQAGIYELSKKGLRITMAERGDQRPEDFAAEAGGRRTVTEWKRKA
jgi:uncharacterized protein (TIGR03067 family)